MTQQRRAREKVARKLDGRIYVAHFNKPIGPEGDPRKQAGHYLGWTPRTAEERLADHKAGRGARLTQVANALGIDYHIVQDWPGNRDIENQLKLHSIKRLCPECTPSPRVPELIQKAIKREKRSQQYQVRKERIKQAMKGEPTKAEKQRYGAEAAAQLVPGHLSRGRSVEQIREIADNMPVGDKPSDYLIGWERQINDDLAMARELERQDETEIVRKEKSPPVESYRDQLTALQDREAEEYPAWLPTEAELSRTRDSDYEREAV